MFIIEKTHVIRSTQLYNLDHVLWHCVAECALVYPYQGSKAGSAPGEGSHCWDRFIEEQLTWLLVEDKHLTM